MIYRHPAVLANMAATTDIISGGRLELGIGAGWNQMEYDAYGIDLPPLKERFDRFDEGVQAMIALLTEKSANFDGQYVKLTDAYCEPKAVQTPHPPITIGGKGPKRTLRAVARWAQHWNVIVPSPAEWTPLKERFDRFDEGVQAMIALLTEKSANFDGQYVKLTDAYCEPKAVQTPHPPITIGGKGPKRTLRAVARWAQHWNVIVASPEEWKPLKDILVQHCSDIGRDVNEITCSVNIRIDPDQPLDVAVAAAAAYGEAGVDLAVMNLPLDAPPSVLEPLAKALAPLA